MRYVTLETCQLPYENETAENFDKNSFYRFDNSDNEFRI